MERWISFNPQARKYEDCDPELGEFFPGDQVIRLFYDRGSGKWCTIPGASLHVFDQQGQLALVTE